MSRLLILIKVITRHLNHATFPHLLSYRTFLEFQQFLSGFRITAPTQLHATTSAVYPTVLACNLISMVSKPDNYIVHED